ncbi:MAG: hypothetical protein Q8O53_01110 [Candidatus Moranbacteria bacterium]|nr:hypothetical protein [Candidatus Moranbacteria bacterium]
MTYLTVLRPGSGHTCSPNALFIEISPTSTLKGDRAYWQERGEFPDIVEDCIHLGLSPEASDFLEEIQELTSKGNTLEALEEILAAVFEGGRAHQKKASGNSLHRDSLPKSSYL